MAYMTLFIKNPTIKALTSVKLTTRKPEVKTRNFKNPGK